MKLSVIVFLLLFFSFSRSEQKNTPEHFFLCNYNYVEKEWDINTTSTINHLAFDATIDSLHLLNDALSYSGCVSIPFDNILPLNETHSLYLKRHGKRLSGGITGVFSLSKLQYTYTVAQSNLRPGHKENSYEYYSKSRTMFADHSTFDYGGTCNLGLNWSNKTAILMGGGSAIQNTGYMVTIDKPYNDGSYLEIADFDKKEFSYKLHGGLLLSSNATVLRRKYFYLLSVEALYSHIKNPIHAPQTLDPSLLFTGKKTETNAVVFQARAYQFNEVTTNSIIGKHVIRPLYIGINNLQLQISTVTDTITDYYLYALDQQHVAGKKGFRKNQTEFTGTIVPELTILNRFNLQWISCISTKLFNSTQTNFISTAGIVSFLIPFNNGLLARVILNSGDFKFNFTYREGNVFFSPVYCAYSASIALQLSMR